MKKIKYSKELELDVYNEKLENGLDVYLVPMPNKDKYFITYGTYFGSTTTTFTPKGEKSVKVPDGIAHFLEHKMFEQESGEDPFTFYSKHGTECNASTNYDITKYIAVGTKNFKDDLKYLISYVNSPYFTDENVEKEKGIIAQEINMYKDEAEYAISDTIKKNTYKVDNHRVDIAGEVKDIETITKEDLYLCYNNFYNPNNMFLLVVGNFDMDIAESVINTDLIPLKNKVDEVSISEVNEPVAVSKKNEKVSFNISIPKVMVSIKTPRINFKIEDEVKLDLYLSFIMRIAFGNSSTFKERVTNNNLMTRFYTDIESVSGYKTIYLYGESAKPNDLLRETLTELKNIKITSEDLERMKKVFIASEIKQADYVDGVTMSMSIDLERYHRVINNPIEIFKSLNLKELKEVLNSIEVNNKAVVTYIPENMKSFTEE